MFKIFIIYIFLGKQINMRHNQNVEMALKNKMEKIFNRFNLYGNVKNHMRDQLF